MVRGEGVVAGFTGPSLRHFGVGDETTGASVKILSKITKKTIAVAWVLELACVGQLLS